MARSDRSAQSDRAKNGSELESRLRKFVEGILYSENLDEKFSLEKEVPLSVDGQITSLTPTADLCIKHTKTGEYVAAFGCKASLRDRRSQDFWASYCWRQLYKNAPWFEYARSEKPNEYDVTVVEKDQERYLKESQGFWKYLAYERYPASLGVLSSLIIEFLKKKETNEE